MASLKSQQQLFGESISEPESLELDYDMWQGQFDFIGPTQSTPAIRQKGTSSPSSSSDDSNLNLVFERLHTTKTPILIDEETFLSLHPHDFTGDAEGGPDGPHSGLFFDHSPPSLTNTGSGKKNKRIDNFFNANLQKQKILFMNDKNVSDSLEREKPESEVEASGDDEEFSGHRINYDINNNNLSPTQLKGRKGGIFDNRLIMRNKCDTLNDQVSDEGVGDGNETHFNEIIAIFYTFLMQNDRL